MCEPRLHKGLGQHHLVEPRLCRPLIAFLQPGDSRVLEIGPGGGALTGQLLQAHASIVGWELDLAWAATLRRRYQGAQLSVVVGDALELDWTRLPAPTLVTGNLPYGIASALIRQVIRHPLRIPRAAFLVQQEVAERIAARPGDRDYSSLSVVVQSRARIRLLGRVRPGSFRPPPKVGGAFVGLELKTPPLVEREMASFELTVRQAFAQRRKTLRNSLAAAWGRVESQRVLDSLGIDHRVRAQDLAPDVFVELHRRRAGS